MSLTVWGRGNGSKALARELGVRRNVRADYVIVWKRLDDIPFRTRKVFNPIDAVRESSNKYRELIKFQEAGLHIPFVTRDRSLVKEMLHDRPQAIFFGRDFYHTKGQDIVVLTGRTRSIPEKDYYIQYLKPTGEYRYHVAFGRVILPTKKVLADGERDDTLIRNHQDGKWRQVVCQITDRFATASVVAIKSLGLDFGGVDFLNVDGEAYILEVNTACGLEVQNRLEAYAKAFREKVR